MKINKRIEIVSSTQSRLSSMSHRSRNAILTTLARHYTEVAITFVDSYADLQRLIMRKPDLVFLGMHFVPMDGAVDIDGPNRAWISDYLDMHDIAYTGSERAARELEVNKPFAKKCLQNKGLRTSPFYVARQNQSIVSTDITLEYPVFIKPTNRGGGLGVDNDSLALTFTALESKIRSITEDFQSDSLVEEYLPGREFSVAILKNNDDDFLVMPVEVIAPENTVLGGEVKSLNIEQRLKVLDPVLKSQVSALALNAFHALGARDYGRIDIRLDKHGVPHFLEANLLPSLISGYGSFPIACMLYEGLNYESMILHIVNLALSRSKATVDNESEIAPMTTAFSY